MQSNNKKHDSNNNYNDNDIINYARSSQLKKTSMSSPLSLARQKQQNNTVPSSRSWSLDAKTKLPQDNSKKKISNSDNNYENNVINYARASQLKETFASSSSSLARKSQLKKTFASSSPSLTRQITLPSSRSSLARSSQLKKTFVSSSLSLVRQDMNILPLPGSSSALSSQLRQKFVSLLEHHSRHESNHKELE